MKKTMMRILPLLLAVLCLTACGSAKSSDSFQAMAPQSTIAGKPGTAAMTTVSETAAAMEENYEMEGAGMGTPGKNSDSGLSSEMNVTAQLPQGRKLIRNVTMHMETNDFEQLVSKIQTDIAAMGGYAEQSDVAGNSLNYLGEPMSRYANITARIPSDKLDGFVSTVEQSGNVINKSESTQDVTLQYSDVESRKKSLLIEQDRIWVLLEKAESVENIISLEQRLSDIRYELESMESQLRLYDNQVDYSTVYINIDEVTSLTPTAPETAATRIKNGLAKNTVLLMDTLTALLIGIITTLPFWLPLLLIALLVVWLVKGRKKKEKAGKTVPTDENAEKK